MLHFSRARQQRFLISVWLLLPAVIWATEPEAGLQQWLSNISNSKRKLNYEGTFIYQCGRQTVSMKIVHVSDEQGEREHLESLNGPPLKILQDDDHITAVLTGQQGEFLTQHAQRSLPSAEMFFDHALEALYDLTSRGYDRTAGRKTRVLEISPKDQFRYGYRIWVDEETGLVLRSEMVDEKGKVIEMMMFTSFRLLPEAVQLAEAAQARPLETGSPETTGSVETDSAQDARSWRIATVPDGFHLAKRSVSSRGGKAASEHWLYTDGLASVSVFIERREPDSEPFEGTARMGAVNAFGKMVDGHQVTVVGEVPIVTVKKIGQSIARLP